MIEEQFNSQGTKHRIDNAQPTDSPVLGVKDGASGKNPDTHIPCDMYRVCDGYDELKCSPQFRNICRKLDDYYWKGEDRK